MYHDLVRHDPRPRPDEIHDAITSHRYVLSRDHLDHLLRYHTAEERSHVGKLRRWCTHARSPRRYQEKEVVLDKYVHFTARPTELGNVIQRQPIREQAHGLLL